MPKNPDSDDGFENGNNDENNNEKDEKERVEPPYNPNDVEHPEEQIGVEPPAEHRTEDEKEDAAIMAYEAPVRDMADVFEKVITPKSTMPQTTRDIKLTKTTWEERQFIVRLKSMIHLCNKKGLEKAGRYYEEYHDHYVNLLASDGGFTAKNLVTGRHEIKKSRLEEEEGEKRKKKWF